MISLAPQKISISRKFTPHPSPLPQGEREINQLPPRAKTTTIMKRGCAPSESELRLERFAQANRVTPLIASF